MQVSPLNLKVMAHILEIEGHSKAGAFKRCGLALEDFEDENGEWVPLSQFIALVDATVAETQDPAFGLVAGKSLALTRFGVMASVALFTPSLRQLISDIDRFAVLLLDRAEFSLEEDGDRAHLTIHPVMREGAAGRFRYDFVATGVVQMLKFLGMTDADLHAVELPFACEPELLPRYENHFGPNVKFKQRISRVSFNPALLDLPHTSHDQLSYTAARTRAELALTAQRSRIDTAERVRQWLMASFPKQPGIVETARHLGMSERSLRRRLSTLETSHQDLTQECQYLKARSLLAEGQLSIKQVADALGFSSVTSFHRAFKRWTGTTPVLWRGEQVSP